MRMGELIISKTSWGILLLYVCDDWALGLQMTLRLIEFARGDTGGDVCCLRLLCRHAGETSRLRKRKMSFFFLVKSKGKFKKKQSPRFAA